MSYNLINEHTKKSIYLIKELLHLKGINGHKVQMQSEVQVAATPLPSWLLMSVFTPILRDTNSHETLVSNADFSSMTENTSFGLWHKREKRQTPPGQDAPLKNKDLCQNDYGCE